jgi:protein tyrosine/serine phosphatase
MAFLSHVDRPHSVLTALFRSTESRVARRRARAARFSRPISGAVHRIGAWAHMIFADHGALRLVYLNHHQVSHKLSRCAQPAPQQIASFAASGVRTVVNLRGGTGHGGWPLEREACEQHGIVLVSFAIRATDAPDRDTILRAKEFFAGLEYPAVAHCKSGADRAGFFAALYILLEGGTAAEAMEQLSLRYGHNRYARAGILDAFLERYQADGEAKGIPFLEWVERHYDAEALARDFKPRLWADFIATRIMRRD